MNWHKTRYAPLAGLAALALACGTTAQYDTAEESEPYDDQRALEQDPAVSMDDPVRAGDPNPDEAWPRRFDRNAPGVPSLAPRGTPAWQPAPYGDTPGIDAPGRIEGEGAADGME